MEQEIHLQRLILFFLAASFYLYEFILQVAPSVMAESMMKTFGVTGQGFGVISAFIFMLMPLHNCQQEYYTIDMDHAS